jgi:hypothetical protein
VQLVTADNPILRKVCHADFAVNMHDIMPMFALLQGHKALGLAAPQGRHRRSTVRNLLGHL